MAKPSVFDNIRGIFYEQGQGLVSEYHDQFEPPKKPPVVVPTGPSRGGVVDNIISPAPAASPVPAPAAPAPAPINDKPGMNLSRPIDNRPPATLPASMEESSSGTGIPSYLLVGGLLLIAIVVATR